METVVSALCHALHALTLLNCCSYCQKMFVLNLLQNMYYNNTTGYYLSNNFTILKFICTSNSLMF